MDFPLPWKDVMAFASLAFGVAGFVPYFIGVLKRKNTPHAYTWLIWAVTQGTATAGVLAGAGGVLAAMNLGIGATACGVIFLLSFKYGTKNITKGDTLVLAAALLAVLIWWQLESALLAVIMVTLIDALGYLPTYRKIWREPYSENITSWTLFAISPALSLLALYEYNALTIPYLAMIMAANTLLVALALLRRHSAHRAHSL